MNSWIITNPTKKKSAYLRGLRREDFVPSKATLTALENSINVAAFENISAMYAYTLDVEAKSGTNDVYNIIIRVLETAWYGMTASVQKTDHRASKSAIECLVWNIGKSAYESGATLDIVRWQAAGRRFQKFAKAVCGPRWILVLLTYPRRLPNQYVTNLQLSGPKFAKATLTFRKFVNDVTHKEPQINRLADKLTTMLQQPLIRFLRPVQSVNSALHHILSYEGLIKFTPGSFQGPTQTILQEFLLMSVDVRSVCTGRTLLRDNIYAELLPLFPCNEVLQSIVYALAASYYKEYLEDGSQEQQAVSNFEATCIQRTSDALQVSTNSSESNTSVQNPGLDQHSHRVHDLIRMLYVHHAIINPSLHDQSWTWHLRELVGPCNDAAVVLASHSIWLMAFLPLNNGHNFLTFTFSWLGSEPSTLDKIHGIVGCSRSLLLIQYYIRSIAMQAEIYKWSKDERMHQGLEVIRRLQNLGRWVDKTEKESAQDIALKTHDAFVDATILYAYVRFMHYVPNDPLVQSIASRLAHALCSLPSEGKLYSGIHPAWCFLIACACTTDSDQYNSMIAILNTIGRRNKSNVSAVAGVAGIIWEWKETQAVVSEGWWEDMTLHIREKMGDNLICVT